MLWGVSRSTRQRFLTIPWRSRCCSEYSLIKKWGLPAGSTFKNGRLYNSLSRGKEHHEGLEEWAEKESFDVRIGGAGNVRVDIFNPSLLSNPSTPLLIYLPPTGTHLSEQHPPIPSYLLTSHSSLARINYRWNIPTTASTCASSKQLPVPFASPHSHPFPIPIHDTWIAYNHLLSRFGPSPATAPSKTGRKLYISFPPLATKHSPRPILIYGSFLGGSLATSLALTESHSSKQYPVRIGGLISKSGVYDWVGAASVPLHFSPTESNPETTINEGWDINTLTQLRESLFSNPASCLDSFASPTLFFRTASIAVPKSWSQLSPFTSTSSNDKRVSTSLPGVETHGNPLTSEVGIWDDYDDSNSSFLSTDNNGKKREEVDLEPVAKRAHLKFPAKDSGLKIPRALFLYRATNLATKGKGKKKVGEEGKQAEDMANLMRRSIVQYEFKERVLWDEDLDPKAAAAERVRTSSLPISNGELDEEGLVREWIEESLG